MADYIFPPESTSSGGDVVGPASSTDNAVVRFDGVTGKLLQDSSVTMGDDGKITMPSFVQFSAGGNFPNAAGAVGIRSATSRTTLQSSGAATPIDFSYGNTVLFEMENNTFHPRNSGGADLGKSGTPFGNIWLTDTANINFGGGGQAINFGVAGFTFNAVIHAGGGIDCEGLDITDVAELDVDTVNSTGSIIFFNAGTIVSANDTTLNSGQLVSVTVGADINRLSAPPAGANVIWMFFDGVLNVLHNQAAGGGFFPILLSGAATFTTSANSTLGLRWNGSTAWVEISRTVI